MVSVLFPDFSHFAKALPFFFIYLCATKFEWSYCASDYSLRNIFPQTHTHTMRVQDWDKNVNTGQERKSQNKNNKIKPNERTKKKCLRPHKIFRTKCTVKLIGRSGGRLIIIHLFSHLEYKNRDHYRVRERVCAKRKRTTSKQKRNQIQTQINKVGRRFQCFLSLAWLSFCLSLTFAVRQTA